MKKNFRKLVITLVCMVLAITTFAMNSTKSIYATNDDQKLRSVFSIDAGRKYFFEEQLIRIVENAYKNGYTDVQILLGNDALRLFLDDMSLSVNGKNYASDDVKAALTKGNSEYYNDPNGNALTQAEIERVLAYAKSKGMNIIPVINTPGHMDSILVAMEELGISNPAFQGSKRTVDVTNKEAVDFAQALVKKYVDFFSEYCEIFNFGCDEYANDVNSGGWQKLQDQGFYDEFIAYVNGLAKIIKDANMLPMCFNDGIYYNSNDSFGTFDKDIIISYWIAGWWGYDVAKPEYLVEKGHKILNTNDGWYWVLGNYNYEEHNNPYFYEKTVTNINSKKFTEVAGAKGEIPIIGSMQCVWSDYPEATYEEDVVFELMDLFSSKHSDYLIRPADYTKVEEALAKIPADLSIYTDESVNALIAAKDAVVYNLDISKQAEVDAMAKAINDAIANLKLKEVNNPSDSNNPETTKPETAPATGDMTNMYFFVTTAMAAGALAVLLRKKRA